MRACAKRIVPVAVVATALLAGAGPARSFTGIPEEDSLAVVETPACESIVSDLPDSAASPELPIEDLDRGIDVATYAGHPRVASYLRYFSGRGRGQMERWLQRGARYLPMIRGRLAEEGLPQDLGYLALIESGFSNNAVSRAGAVGMWQFMPGTARAYGLRVDRHVDERRNPVKATEAAVRHLRDLTDQFGSPYLAAAAYNAGAGRVSTGLERLRSMETEKGSAREAEDAAAFDASARAGSDAGHPADIDFFRLSDSALLARETRNYVPQLIAAALIARNPAEYGFTVGADTLASNLMAESQAYRHDRAAKPRLGMGKTLARGLDRSRATAFRSDRDRAAGWARPVRAEERSTNAFRRRHAVVRRGDTIEAIARRHEVSVERLRKVNALPEWYVMRPGMILTLPSS